MSDKYYRGLKNIINDTKYKLQLAPINLKINENRNNISIIKNDISGINDFTGKINDNETNISDNLSKINDNTSSISTNFGLLDTNTSNISSNLGKIGINTAQINKNTSDIADNIRKIGINTVDISTNLSDITNIKKTFMLKNIYFTDFDSIERSFTNQLLYFHYKDHVELSATIKNLNMEYSFKKDDFIEIECKLMISHDDYEESKNNLSFHYSLYNKTLNEDNLLFKEIRDYSDFPLFNDKRSIITYVKICYKVKYDTSNIIFTSTIHSKSNDLYLIIYHHIIEHGVNYISIKHYGN